MLIGPVASGKSTWAAAHFASNQVVSSDVIRAVVGEAEHDQRASDDAFAVLDQIVVARMRRRLTTVVDTMGFDPTFRARWRGAAHAAGMPCLAVVFDTPAAEFRRRNATREVPVPASAVSDILRRWPGARDAARNEPWDELLTPTPVVVVPATLVVRPRAPAAVKSTPEPSSHHLKVGLHLSSFDWPGGRERLGDNLSSIARDAEAAGVDHLWVMDHLRQIPQVGPAWADLPDPYVTLTWLAAATERIRLGTLVSPAFLHRPAALAKQVATLDVLSAGRAICGLGVGWFAQEYAAAGITFPSLDQRYAYLEDALQMLPVLWGKGAPRFEGSTATLADTTSYPRPLQQHVPIIVGGSGERRTLRLAARYADGCNLFGEPDVVARKVAALRHHCDDVERDVGELDVSQLSTVLIGLRRDDVAMSIDRLRPKRISAERFAAQVNAGTVADHYERSMRLIDAGVRTLIVRLVDVTEPGAIERLGTLIERLR